ncbi:MAG: hypothetical protein QF385_13910, partial [SAR324 cluster bacterium]|nr:hypothetical protein [SAR324 cluster bacterium]
TGLNGFNFEETNYFLKYSLILFMIIGRVELLTVLILCKKFFFKNINQKSHASFSKKIIVILLSCIHKCKIGIKSFR